MHHLILGAGPAGVIAAETLRRLAPADRVTLVGDEREAPYSRMAIPYLLIGDIAEAGTHLRHGATHYRDQGIELVQARATAIDAAARRVTLDNGQTLDYDRLLVATGSAPVRPPIPGMDLPGVHSCWTLEDARKIMAEAGKGQRVLQMGAGFIGCIIMEALAARGVALTVVEMGDRMVPRMMGPTAGGMIKAWCEAKGVTVHTGARVERIEAVGTGLLGKLATAVGLGDGKAGGMVAHLSNGQRVEADVVISATGVRPAVGFLQGSGVECRTGVVTDARMRTNVDGVFAAGDCAEAFDKFSGGHVVSAIQPNAADQARVAALNMLGRDAELRNVTQINVLDTLGLISTSFGAWEGVPGGEQFEATDHAAARHLSLQFKDDVLVGCNSVGWTGHVGAMRGLVEGQVHLGEWKARLQSDPTQLMTAYLACAQASDRWTGAADERRR